MITNFVTLLTPEQVKRVHEASLEILEQVGMLVRNERARQIFFDGEVPNFQVIIPDFGVVEGPFQITSIEYAGSHNGEATYELALASAGALSFTAI